MEQDDRGLIARSRASDGRHLSGQGVLMIYFWFMLPACLSMVTIRLRSMLSDLCDDNVQYLGILYPELTGFAEGLDNG